MSFEVLMTQDAARDLEEIYDYITQQDAPGKAEYVLEKIEKTFMTLSGFPERGTPPKEITSLGTREYREIFFKPYRIIYKITENIVYILLIVDGRRDMQTVLNHRLLAL